MKILFASEDSSVYDNFNFYKGFWIDRFDYKVYANVNSITLDPEGQSLFDAANFKSATSWIDEFVDLHAEE